MAGFDYSSSFAGINGALANLGKSLQANREREDMAAIGNGVANGSLDYSQAAGKLLSLGRPDAAVEFLKMGETRRQRVAGEDAARALGNAIGGSGGSLATLGQGAPAATGSALPAVLNSSESGGNWGAQNSAIGAGGAVGHFGRAQFGQARLQEAANAGAIPQGTTPEMFMRSPELQRAAENWHFADIDQNIRANGFDRLIGQSINGIPITADGLRAVAHLGGKQGLQRFIETGGQYNPSDRNGTSLMDYLRLGARSGGQSAAADMPAPGAANVSLDTGSNGFAVPGQPAMTGRTFDAITSGNQPLRPSFEAEGVSQPWMGNALAPPNLGRPVTGESPQASAAGAGQVLPPRRPYDLASDLPARGAVPAIGQMPPIDRAGAIDIDPNSQDGGARAFQLQEAQPAQAGAPAAPSPAGGGMSAAARPHAPQANPVPAGGDWSSASVGTGSAATAAAGNQAQAPVLTKDMPHPTTKEQATEFYYTKQMEAQRNKAGALASALANPNLPANARAVGEIFLKDALEQSKAPDSVKEFMYARGMGWTTAKNPQEYQREKQAAPSDVQEYEYAQSKGYKGTYLEFQGDKATAKSTKTTASEKVDENTAAADKQGLQGDERKFFIANGRLPTASEKMTEGQANAALYADRMRASNEILSRPEIATAAADPIQRGKAMTPGVGNYWASPQFQMADQAQRDFINAALRRESGAAISPSEFENARKQYFPQPGDSKEVLAQKARNRQIAIDGISNAAGPSYAKRQQQSAQGAASQAGDTPPLPNARRGNDGVWYVPDLARPGKYQRVD